MVDKLLRNLGESLLVIGLFVGISAGFNYLCGKNYFRNMPRDVNVSEDFVKPSKIEIKLKAKNKIANLYSNDYGFSAFYFDSLVIVPIEILNQKHSTDIKDNNEIIKEDKEKRKIRRKK